MKLAQVKLAQWKLAGWKGAAVSAAVPSFSLGNTAVVKFGGNLTGVSGYLNTFELLRTLQLEDTTGLLNTSKACAATKNNTETKFAGYFDPTMQALLESNIGTPATFQYSPAGTATGNTTYSGTATLNAVAVKSSQTEANKIECGLAVHGLTYATL